MIQYLVIILVSFLASVIGSICGIGGGVIIKPVLDATGLISVDTISFLSGCTVLSMSAISVFKNLRNRAGAAGETFDIRIAVLLAGGGAVGGIIGKAVYQAVLGRMAETNTIGAVQGIALCLITVGTLLYTIKKERIQTIQIQGTIPCVIIGLLLGVMSAFLGIGGGPINLVVLYFFFSMGTKQAAVYSLYIIMFSQTASLLSSIAGGSIPEFSLPVLALMVGCGVLGGILGVRINKKIRGKMVDKLFIGLMIVIILINIYNVIKYL